MEYGELPMSPLQIVVDSIQTPLVMELSEPQDWMQHQSVIAAGELPLFLPQILVEWMDYPKHQSVMDYG